MSEAAAQPRDLPGPRRRYHFHAPGVLYVAVTLFLAVGAINSQNNLLFSALGLAIGGLLVSGILSGASLMGVRLERLHTPHGSVGAPLLLRYAVRNTNRFFPAFGLHIVEVDAADGPGWRRFIPEARTFVVHAGPGQTVGAQCSVVPRRRGEMRVRAVQVWSTFPFGLAKKSVTFHLPQTTLVHPPRLPLRPGLVARLASRADQGYGGERDPGPGDEFYGLREYIAGDNPRRIAWKRSARTGQVVVRQHAAPTPQKAWIVLDLDTPGGDPGATWVARERAVALASAVLRDAAQAGIAVGLAVPATRVLVPLRDGRWHLDRLLSQLAMLDVDDLPPGAPSPPLPASTARSGACIVVHAGRIDGVGPPHARHLAAGAADQYLQSSESAAALLTRFTAPPPAPTSPKRRIGERLRHLARTARSGEAA